MCLRRCCQVCGRCWAREATALPDRSTPVSSLSLPDWSNRLVMTGLEVQLNANFVKVSCNKVAPYTSIGPIIRVFSIE